MKERRTTGIVDGALAFDLRVAGPMRRRPLATAEAHALAVALRRNLMAECAEIGALRLRLAPAFYDPCALLRPGWPLHRRLRDAHARDEDTFTIVGFEHLPEPRGFNSGRELLSLPFVLDGPADRAKEAARRLDENRMRTHMPRARDPAFEWSAMPAFDAVGFLSLRSLSAEIGARYYAEGLGDVWTLIERALRTPDGEHALEARTAAGVACTLRYAAGRVRIDGEDDAWKASCLGVLRAHGMNAEATNAFLRVVPDGDETP
jgi:hypothetical protein